MDSQDSVVLTRDCRAVMVPAGDVVTLKSGETVRITQSLGASFTVVVSGNMFQIDGADADALGREARPSGPSTPSGEPLSAETLEKQVWEQMKQCYDPEIPVNIVDLGLVFDCHVTPASDSQDYQVEVKMTLTAPGCGMGDSIRGDVERRILEIEQVIDTKVDLVWEPQWNQSMMSDAAKLQLGLF